MLSFFALYFAIGAVMMWFGLFIVERATMRELLEGPGSPFLVVVIFLVMILAWPLMFFGILNTLNKRNRR